MRLVLIVVLAALAASCNRGDNNKTPPTKRPATAAVSKQPRPVYPEDDVLAIMRALDTAEIVTSGVARETSQNDEVLRYAGVMIKDHGDIMQLLAQTGVAPRENAISAKIRRDADSIARGLRTLPQGFNNTYIEEQVKSHRKALQQLDSVIIPSAQTPALRSLLEKLRPAVLAHLQRAMQILAMRRKEGEERGEPWVSGLQNVGIAPATSGGPPLLGEPAPAQPGGAQPRPTATPKPKPKPDTVRRDTTRLTTTSNM